MRGSWPWNLKFWFWMNLQTDWIRVDTSYGRYSDVDIVREGQFLYNKSARKNTFVFSQGTLEVNIIRFKPWVSLPETARNAIMVRAARVFAYREMGDTLRSGYAQLDEDAALEVLNQAETDQADYSFEDVGIPALARRDGGGAFALPTFPTW